MAGHLDIPFLFTLALTLCLAWVILSDGARYVISNNVNLTILLLYGVAIFFLPTAPLSALATAGIVLAAGLAFFALGLMGGGDIKLLVVLSLWTGWSMVTVNFLFLTAIFGGVLVLVVLLLRFLLPPLYFNARPNKPAPRLFTRQQPVPYGIAIAAAFLWLLWQDGIPLLATH